METPEIIEPEINNNNMIRPTQTDTKQYTLKLNKDHFKLTIKISSEESISFNLRQINQISQVYYLKKYKLENFFTILNLSKNENSNNSKIFELFDIIILSKNAKLIQGINKDNISLYLKYKKNSEEKECKFFLEKEKIKTNEMLNILIDEINEIKKKEIENNDIDEEKKNNLNELKNQ